MSTAADLTAAATAEPAPTTRRRLAIERAVVGAVVVLVLVEVLRVGAGVSGGQLALSWQLLDRDILSDDLVRGLFFLHTQPPLHNAVVGAVLTSPLPAEGTIFVLYGCCLLVLGLLVHDLGRRWGLPGPVAVVVAALAVADPMLLSTIALVGYEVPVATLLVGLVALLDRQVTDPTARRAVAIAGVGTAIVLTRALFHPAWLAVLLALILIARPVSRRAVLAAAAIPVVLIGGLVIKNAALVGSPSLSSWSGFNVQRGIIAPMARADVEAAVAAGAVTGLATQPAWQELGTYEPWLDGCRPTHDHPALADPTKPASAVATPNFNAECYVGLYDESSSNAWTLVRRHPGRYLSTRVDALALSFAVLPLGTDDPTTSFVGERTPSTSWMDRLFGPLLLRQHTAIDMTDWNVPLYGTRLGFELSWTLVACVAIVLVRTLLAVGRTIRSLVADRTWPGAELVWLLAGGTVLFAIIGGDLVELGENGRFRSMLDPLVFVLVARAVAEVVTVVRHRAAR